MSWNRGISRWSTCGTVGELEPATLQWVCWYNETRLHSDIGHRTAVECKDQDTSTQRDCETLTGPRAPTRALAQDGSKPKAVKAETRMSKRTIGRTTLGLSVSAALCAVAVVPAMAAPAAPEPRGDVTYASKINVKTVRVTHKNNRAAAIVPFTDAIYPSCSGVPKCIKVGKVKYNYQISEKEVTVGQWVAFLNVVNPDGRNRHGLWHKDESSSAWPKYGQVNRKTKARRGNHYRVAYPQWATKPYGFADFLRSARFVNSLYNGSSKTQKGPKHGIKLTKHRTAFSPITERGMYNLSKRAATRTSKRGFVIPSQNEWIKAAYYAPKGGGKYGYWKYPTNPGTFGAGQADGPTSTLLNPGNGNVTNSSIQPLATDLVPGTTPPTWCPSQIKPQSACDTVNPIGLPPPVYASLYKASLSTVGQAKTRSPWGTLDQGGNAVEWTDTITAAPGGSPSKRVWRRLHGGVPNSTPYQLWLSAVGLQPQDNAFFERTYPWLGFRVGYIGK